MIITQNLTQHSFEWCRADFQGNMEPQKQTNQFPSSHWAFSPRRGFQVGGFSRGSSWVFRKSKGNFFNFSTSSFEFHNMFSISQLLISQPCLFNFTMCFEFMMDRRCIPKPWWIYEIRAIDVSISLDLFKFDFIWYHGIHHHETHHHVWKICLVHSLPSIWSKSKLCGVREKNKNNHER